MAQTTDAIIALTSAEADYLSGPTVGAPAAKISVVPVGVNLARFTPDGPTLTRGTRPRLVTVSRLAERKGIRTVIEALAALPGCELLIAGGPDPAVIETDPVVRTLRDHARHHGVRDRVTFLGRIPHPEVPALLRSADVFVSAPYYEPFGTSALEAAACGIPVVTTNVGGLREHVRDQVTGYLIPPPDPARPQPGSNPVAADIASATATLIADPLLRARLGTAGAREAARYAWPAIVDQIINVYQKL